MSKKAADFDLDSWLYEAPESLSEGDLDDIIEETIVEPPKPVKVTKNQSKPKAKQERKNNLFQDLNNEFKISDYICELEFQVLKEVFTAYKSQYQKYPHNIQRFKLLLKKLGIDFDSDLVVQSQRRRRR